MPCMNSPYFFCRLPFFNTAFKELQAANVKIFQFFAAQIESHRKQRRIEEETESVDFVDAYLREIQKKDASGLPHSFRFSFWSE